MTSPAQRDTSHTGQPHDGVPDGSIAISTVITALRGEYAAELRYRRLVAWVACALVGVLLLAGIAGVYIHQERIAGLEEQLSACQALAEERAETVSLLKLELIADRQIEPQLRNRAGGASE